MIKITYDFNTRSFSESTDNAQRLVDSIINNSGNESATAEGFWKARRKVYKAKFKKDHEPLVKRNTIIGAVAGTGLGVGAGYLMTRNTLNRVANRHPDWDYDRVKKRANLIKAGTMVGTGVAGGVLGGVVTNKMTKFDIDAGFNSRIPKYPPKLKPKRK
jgi:hypothetical protein